jgi:hypothetical protein
MGSRYNYEKQSGAIAQKWKDTVAKFTNGETVKGIITGIYTGKFGGKNNLMLLVSVDNTFSAILQTNEPYDSRPDLAMFRGREFDFTIKKVRGPSCESRLVLDFPS